MWQINGEMNIQEEELFWCEQYDMVKSFDLSAIQGFKWGSPKQAKMKPWTSVLTYPGAGGPIFPFESWDVTSSHITYNYGFISTYNWNWSIIASRCR